MYRRSLTKRNRASPSGAPLNSGGFDEKFMLRGRRLMKAPAVDYVRPCTLEEAVELLAKHEDMARVIAGGQSLVAMMNLRIVAPGLLIEISRLPELISTGGDADTVV